MHKVFTSKVQLYTDGIRTKRQMQMKIANRTVDGWILNWVVSILTAVRRRRISFSKNGTEMCRERQGERRRKEHVQTQKWLQPIIVSQCDLKMTKSKRRKSIITAACILQCIFCYRLCSLCNWIWKKVERRSIICHAVFSMKWHRHSILLFGQKATNALVHCTGTNSLARNVHKFIKI